MKIAFAVIIIIGAFITTTQSLAYTECSGELARIWAGDKGNIWLHFDKGSARIVPGHPDYSNILTLATAALSSGKSIVIRYEADGVECASEGRTDVVGVYLASRARAFAASKCPDDREPTPTELPCWKVVEATLRSIWQYPKSNGFLTFEDFRCPVGRNNYVVVNGSDPHFDTSISIALAALLSEKRLRVDYFRGADDLCHLQSITILK